MVNATSWDYPIAGASRPSFRLLSAYELLIHKLDVLKCSQEEVMPYRIGVQPSKPVSLLGMLAGGLFVVLGVAVVMPRFGIVGLVWTAFAALITLYHAYNFFSTKGLSTYEVNVQSPSFDAQLRELANLREDGLLSQDEFER